MNKQVSLVLASIFIVVLLLGTVSAANWDNKKQFTLDDTTSKYGKIDIYNSFFLGLGRGDKLWQAELKYNTDTCGEYCSAEKEITIYEDGALIDDIKFETINSDGSRTEQDIRSYKFYVLQNGIKIPYEIGQNVKAGTYQIILEGEKKSSRTVDWQIKSNGKWSVEWAVWGSLHGDEYYLIIKAEDIDVASLEINTVTITNISDNVWKMNTTNANNDISRALVMKTLFYGTDGSNPKANSTYFTNVVDVFSNDDRDSGKRGTFAKLQLTGTGPLYANYTGTFSDTTNNLNSSAWSFMYIDSSNEAINSVFEFPKGTIVNSLAGTSGTSDELGTNTSADQQNNPPKVFLHSYSGDGSIVLYTRAVVLSVGAITDWTYAETGTVNEDLVNTDFFADFGFPVFTLLDIVTVLNSPDDDYISSTNEVLFNCSASVGGATLVNMSLWTNQSGTFQQENITTGLGGTTETITWNHTILNDGYYLWGCEACDSDDDCSISLENRTVIIDTSVPELTINLPTTLEDYVYIGENESLNWTYTDPHPGSCWYNYNGTDVDVNCTEGNATFILEEGNLNMTFYANDSVNNLNTTYFNWTYKVLENSRNFSILTYETDTQTYQVNVTANSSLTSTALIYGGTSYASTLSGDTYTTTITHSTNGTREIYWNFTYAGDIFSSYSSNQTVNSTEFNICNVSDVDLNTTFLNITFLDEETLTRIGSQIDTSTFEYWLGDGSVTETLIYSNLTNISEYNFCFTPAHRTMQNTREIQYSATGYPQRKYDDSTDLTNTTTHKTLYLLSSADGIYSTIQIVDENGDIVTGADVTMERQFTGVWTIVGKETTDGAGAVTFWVNPDYDHRFTIEKSGCVTLSETIRPTQTTYTATIDCLGVSDEVYVAPIEGIKYFLLPSSGIITTGNQNFSFQVVSSKDNIVNAKFEIVNGSGYILTSQTSACAAAGCTISIMYNVTSVQNIKGKYYVDLGDGYILLEADAHWIEVDIPDRDGTFKQFWLNLRGVFDEWHEVGEDTTNTGDFNRIVFIFLFLSIFIAVFNKLTHFDSSNPGAFLIFLTTVVFMGSIAGFPDGKGFFYLDNFGVSYFINNYIILGYMLLITITHYVGVQLQKQR